MDGNTISGIFVALGAIVSAGVMAAGTVYAAKLARGVKDLQARTQTNHGGTIGTHIEDLVDSQEDLLDWCEYHQEMDNDMRQQLGLPRIVMPVRKRSVRR